MTQFEDYEDVLKVFYESAYRAYEYDGGLYAIPETQTYNVMFYRKDILEELEIEVPQTWDEVINLLPTIQGNNMEIGIPSPTSTTLPDLSLYYTLLYQNGTDVYDEDAKQTIIDNEAGVNAFAQYTSFFTDYGMPTEYDFVSRFRSGQMPIGIAAYSTYNTLVVSAPEIRGLWDFTLIPGTVRTDDSGNETMDRSVYSTGTCSMMIRSEDPSSASNSRPKRTCVSVFAHHFINSQESCLDLQQDMQQQIQRHSASWHGVQMMWKFWKNSGSQQ